MLIEHISNHILHFKYLLYVSKVVIWKYKDVVFVDLLQLKNNPPSKSKDPPSQADLKKLSRPTSSEVASPRYGKKSSR